MTLGPLQDKAWLHVGARPPEHVERLARLAGGVVFKLRCRVPVRESSPGLACL
jgi:hypothetical protein